MENENRTDGHDPQGAHGRESDPTPLADDGGFDADPIIVDLADDGIADIPVVIADEDSTRFAGQGPDAAEGLIDGDVLEAVEEPDEPDECDASLASTATGAATGSLEAIEEADPLESAGLADPLDMESFTDALEEADLADPLEVGAAVDPLEAADLAHPLETMEFASEPSVPAYPTAAEETFASTGAVPPVRDDACDAVEPAGEAELDAGGDSAESIEPSIDYLPTVEELFGASPEEFAAPAQDGGLEPEENAPVAAADAAPAEPSVNLWQAVESSGIDAPTDVESAFAPADACGELAAESGEGETRRISSDEIAETLAEGDETVSEELMSPEAEGSESVEDITEEVDGAIGDESVALDAEAETGRPVRAPRRSRTWVFVASGSVAAAVVAAVVLWPQLSAIVGDGGLASTIASLGGSGTAHGTEPVRAPETGTQAPVESNPPAIVPDLVSVSPSSGTSPVDPPHGGAGSSPAHEEFRLAWATVTRLAVEGVPGEVGKDR